MGKILSWQEGIAKEGAIRTQFIITVRTSDASSGLNRAWIRERTDGENTKIKYWMGQKRFMEYRMAALVAELEKLSFETPESLLQTQETFLPALLDTLEGEHFIDSAVRKRHEAMIHEIFAQKGLSSERQAELYIATLQNLMDRIYYNLKDEFGVFEDPYHRALGGKAPRFIDGLLRSTSPFVLGKYVDALNEGLARSKNIVHHVNEREFRGAIEVYNSGDTVGILRIGKNPMALSGDEIAILNEMPTEMNACAGIVTLGAGARLSHVNLLAKALGVPNVKASTELLPKLKDLEGKWVRLRADRSGSVSISLAEEKSKALARNGSVQVPVAHLDIRTPVRFADARKWADLGVAGPKGTHLARAFSDPTLRPFSEDGFILPFGYFDQYLKEIGISPWIEILSKTRIENHSLGALLSGKISAAIESNPIPTALLDKVLEEGLASPHRA